MGIGTICRRNATYQLDTQNLFHNQKYDSEKQNPLGDPMNITKVDLCTRVSARLKSLPNDDIKRYSLNPLKNVLDAFLEEIFNCMAEGSRIEIRHFGYFKPVTKKYRNGRNPRTGEKVEIPVTVSPYFKFSKNSKKILAKKIKEQSEKKNSQPTV